MVKKIQFVYSDATYYASDEVFSEQGLLTYRGAYESNFIVLHERAGSK